MNVTAVIVRGRWISAGKRIHPCSRPDAGLTCVEVRTVGIGTSGAEIGTCSAAARVAAEIAGVPFQSFKGVFHP